jgi:hypothetical protein
MALATNPDSPRAPTRRRTAVASSAGTLTDSLAAGCAMLDSYHGRNGRARSDLNARTSFRSHIVGGVPLYRAHAQGYREPPPGPRDLKATRRGRATPAPTRALEMLEPRDAPVNGCFGRACLWGTSGLFEDTCCRPLAPVSALWHRSPWASLGRRLANVGSASVLRESLLPRHQRPCIATLPWARLPRPLSRVAPPCLTHGPVMHGALPYPPRMLGIETQMVLPAVLGALAPDESV